MSFFQKLFNRKAARDLDYPKMPSGGVPIYTIFDQEVYTSDAVQAAIQCIASEMKKLSPQHVRRGKGEQDYTSIFDSSVQKVLETPNVLMTTSEFIEKVIWELYRRFNAFIIPTFVEYENAEGFISKKYTGLYPIAPTQIDFEENKNGDMFITFKFANNYETTILYDDVIHLRYRFSVNDFLGGDEWGQPDNDTLKETLQINKQLLNGLAAAMQNGMNVNGVVKFNSLLDKGKQETALKEFNELLRNNVSGFLPLDLKSEYIPITRDIKFIDPQTVKFIDEKILRFFGVPLPILTGDYTPQQFEAFYDKTLEPLIVMMSQAFTKALFTPRERNFGNKIIFQPAELVFMTMTEKLNMIRLLGDSGTLFENEKRRAVGLPAIPELEGVRMMSLNYVDSNIAQNYQIGKAQQQSKGGSTDGNEEI